MNRTTFYAWLMVVVAALAMVATLPGRTIGLGMITERLLHDTGLELTRSGFARLNLWATLIGALFCFGIGTWIDRYGVRVMLSLVMFALALTVLAMSQVTSYWPLFVGIALTRGFGQSALSVVSITMVGKWFDSKISIPMAVYSIAMAVGFIVTYKFAERYADLDWRILWRNMGFVLLGLAFLFALVARDRRTFATPRDSSLDVPAPSATDSEPNDFTLGEALRTPMFWVCSVGISLFGMILTGISLFNESILLEQGFSKKVYYDALTLGTMLGLVGKVAAGQLGLHVSSARQLGIALLLLSGSLAMLTRISSYNDVVLYVLVSAIAGGILTVLFFAVWPELYGKTHLGRIQAIAQLLTVLASAFGPVLFAEAKQVTGSYNELLWALAGILLVLAVIAWFTPKPKKNAPAWEVA